MSKLLPTLFLVIVVALVGGVAFLSFTDVPVEQKTIEDTVTYEDFKANSKS